MENIHHERKIPMSWTDWDEVEVCDLMLYNVTFTDDFGPIKKGSKFSSANINYAYGYLEVYSFQDDGPDVVEHHVQFDFTPHCVDYKDNKPNYFEE